MASGKDLIAACPHLSGSPRSTDVPEFLYEYELGHQNSRSGRRTKLGYDEPEPEVYNEGHPSTSGRGGGYGSRSTGQGRRDQQRDDSYAPEQQSPQRDRGAGRGGRDREQARDTRDRPRERDRDRKKPASRLREPPKLAEDLPEDTRLLPPGRNGLGHVDPGGADGDWRLKNQGYGAVQSLWEAAKLRQSGGEDDDEEEGGEPEDKEAYERSLRVLRIATLREFYDTRRRAANILLLGTCALDPALRVGLSIGPNRGVSTLLTPAPWFNAGWAAAYLACLVYALFQALPAEAGRPLLRRIGWLSGLMFASGSTSAVLSSMLSLSSGTLQHFADLWPGVLIRNVGGAAPISWGMVFFSILALLPSGLVLQSLAAPQNRQWAVEDHLLIAAPLSIWSAWMTLSVAENLSIALLSSGLYDLGLGNIDGGPGPAVCILIALTAFACGFIIAGDGNPYYSITLVWAFVGIAQQAHINFAAVGAVSVVAVLAAGAVMIQSSVYMRIKARSGRINRWGEVVPLVIERWIELREAEARGENFKDVALVVNQTLSRLKMIALRFKDLVGGAVTSVST